MRHDAEKALQVQIEAEAQRKIALIRERFGKRVHAFSLQEDVEHISVDDAEGLPQEARQILDKIDDAFPLRPIPKLDPRSKGIEYERFYDFVFKRTWKDVAVYELTEWWESLSYVEPSVLSFYAPGFMAAFLVHWPKVCTIWSIEPDSPLGGRFDQFLDQLHVSPGYDCVFEFATPAQRDIVAHFLGFFFKLHILVYGNSESTSDLGALSDLWEENRNLPTRIP